MLKKTATVAAAAGLAFTAMLGSPAHADTTSGNGSIAGGNQVHIPIAVPVNVCGNAVAVLGVAVAGCEGGATAKNKHHH